MANEFKVQMPSIPQTAFIVAFSGNPHEPIAIRMVDATNASNVFWGVNVTVEAAKKIRHQFTANLEQWEVWCKQNGWNE